MNAKKWITALALAVAGVTLGYEILVLFVPAWLMLVCGVILVSIAIGVGLKWAKFPFDKAHELLKNPVVNGPAIAALLTAIYGTAVYLLYGRAALLLVEEVGVETRTAWLAVTVLGLPLIAVVWRLYTATGIPGDPKQIGRAFTSVALLSLLFFGWWFYAQPNRLFDQETGDSLFLVDPTTGKTHFSGKYSPETGEELRPGTKEDAKQIIAKASWTDRAKEKVSEAFRGGTEYPICGDTAEGAQAVLPGMVEIQLHPECWSGPVSMPDDIPAGRTPHLRVHNGTYELEYMFPDNSTLYFPENSTGSVGHIKWSSFRLRGGGVAKISLRYNNEVARGELKGGAQ